MGGITPPTDLKGKGKAIDDDSDDDSDDETPEAKRRKILLESRDLDADSDGEGGGGGDSGSDAEEDDDDSDSDEDDDDDEEETAQLMRELDKIKRERADQRDKEERERAAVEEEKREVDIARGNPLLNPDAFAVKRRWDDDVIFKNQARGTEERGKKKEFVNDLLRSDFHKKFMVSADILSPRCCQAGVSVADGGVEQIRPMNTTLFHSTFFVFLLRLERRSFLIKHQTGFY